MIIENWEGAFSRTVVRKGKDQEMRKKLIVIHLVLIVLEVVALVHDLQVFGAGMFRYYTIDSNLLQLIVSACLLAFLLRRGEEPLPGILTGLHLICAVCLTITFLIALLVLAPQEGFAYYFLQDVAPINHFLGPVLSVISFLLSGKLPGTLSGKAVLAPMAATLLYGVVALILNAAGVLDGPYFFLRIHSEPVSTVATWFGIIAVLCLILAAIYIWIRKRIRK